MYCHLIAVEVGVVRRAHQRVELDRLAVDELRFEGLDAEPVQRGRAVQHHRVLAHHLREDVPDLRALLLHHLLCGLDGGHMAALLELRVDERLEQLERHARRQTALMQTEFGAHDDHRATGVVHALSEQVLPEATRLALQHVGERLQRALARAGDDTPTAAVVEERVDRFLQHPLLVADDHLGRVQLLEALQAVVTVDHAAVEVVQVAGCEAPTVERHQRSQVGRQHRDDLEDHVLRAVGGLAERVEHLEPLGELLALRLGCGVAHLEAQALALALDVDLREQVADGLGADPELEALAAPLLLHLEQSLVREQLTGLEVGLLRVGHDVRLEIEHTLELAQRDLEDVANA